MGEPTLLLAFEPVAACLDRLRAAGFAEAHAKEIASYLDQSTDIAPEFGAIAYACAARGLSFQPAPLDGLPAHLARCDPANTLVWTLTDGISFFRGSASPALARLGGFQTFGAEDALFALAQDKFRSGAVLAAAWRGTGSGWFQPLHPVPAGSSSRTGLAPRSASGRIPGAAPRPKRGT